jgi:hypothetical protein
MRKIVIRSAAGIVLLLLALGPLVPATGQPVSLPAECQELAFSTEEDFVTQGPVPPGGNVISDGDLLGANCTLCARNADLLAAFLPEIPPEQRPDLGLDAVDVLDAETSLVAFSTSLNSPYQGQFTAGDLLFTTGVIIPNRALTYAFVQGAINYDIGLDGVHFVGTLQNILTFLDAWAGQEPPIPPEQLSILLKRHEVDIWFSTEGTWSAAGAPMLLDGDLLSAQTGAIVVQNGSLLDPTVPADVRPPVNGVDFGLDAVTAPRTAALDRILFSTEILFDGEVSFTDGDVLLFGNGIAIPHLDLVVCFEPHAQFLGLDALHMALEAPQPAEIQGLKFHDLNANGKREADEPGLERWQISLDGTDLAGNVVQMETLTGAAGVYSFTVPAGTYSVTETCLNETWYQSQPQPIDGCGSGVHHVALVPGQVISDVDFGNYHYAVKSGFKFNDLNKNSEWDQQAEPPEPAIANWEIHLEGTDGLGQDVKRQMDTDETGFYRFSVPPGAYTVYEVCPDGWQQTLPGLPDVCGTGVYPFNPVSGDPEHTGNNFGNFQGMGLHLPVILRNAQP